MGDQLASRLDCFLAAYARVDPKFYA